MNAAQLPPEPPAASATKWGLSSRVLSGGRGALLGTAAILAALVGIVTNWNALSTSLFPPKPATAATIVARVEPDISLPEFEVQDQPPAAGSASVATSAPGGAPRWGSGYRFAVYIAPASGQPAAGTLLAAGSGESNSPEHTTTTSTGQTEQKIKEEGDKVTKEAKHAEESVAEETAIATKEQKSAQEHEVEEQKKEQEARKRAEEEAQQHAPGHAALAKAEEERAKTEVQKAKETVRAKQQEAFRPSSQRRIEAGTPARKVAEVLHEAGLPEHVRPTCGLKPIVEKALKATSNDAAVAAQEVRAVNPGTGARVHYDVTLDGLEHKVVVLAYSLVQTSGLPPPEVYLETEPIRTVVPAHEPDVVKGVCWVPLPSSSRQYHLDLTVYDGNAEVESKETGRFW